MVESSDYKDDWCEEQEAPAQLQDIHDRALEKANELAKKNGEMAGDVGILSEKNKTLHAAYAEKAAKLEELRRKLAARQDSVSGKGLAAKMNEAIKEPQSEAHEILKQYKRGQIGHEDFAEQYKDAKKQEIMARYTQAAVRNNLK